MPKNVKNQVGKRFQIQAQILLILEVIWGPGGGILEAFLESGGVIFASFFLVFFGRPQGRPQMAKVVTQGCLPPIET